MSSQEEFRLQRVRIAPRGHGTFRAREITHHSLSSLRRAAQTAALLGSATDPGLRFGVLSALGSAAVVVNACHCQNILL